MKSTPRNLTQIGDQSPQRRIDAERRDMERLFYQEQYNPGSAICLVAVFPSHALKVPQS